MKTLCSHTPLPDKPATGPTVGDIFRAYGPAFRSSHRLHPRQHKVMYDIEHCRCGEFGTHWEICDTCGHLEKGYNSCRNRHCPGCNNIARRRWGAARIDELLPVSYNHCVFTLPDIFNSLCRFNRRIMYDLLFESASTTLLEFGENPKRLGARIEYQDAWYHVMNRGRRAETIFSDEEDYKQFTELLKETSEMWNVRIAAYYLMPNHYHMLVQTPEANISRNMRHLNGVYTQRYNRRHKYDGQLFRGRYNPFSSTRTAIF